MTVVNQESSIKDFYASFGKSENLDNRQEFIRRKRELEDTLDNRVEEFTKLFISNFINTLQIYYHEARNERKQVMLDRFSVVL